MPPGEGDLAGGEDGMDLEEEEEENEQDLADADMPDVFDEGGSPNE